jgi:OOP family OmpA-OmpF porin
MEQDDEIHNTLLNHGVNTTGPREPESINSHPHSAYPEKPVTSRPELAPSSTEKVMQRNILIGAFVAVTALISSAASAQSYYLGGSVGQSTIKLGTSSSDYNTTATSKREGDTGYKVFGGYNLNSTYAIEAGYAVLGRATAKYTSGDVANGLTGQVTNDAWFAAIKAELPLAYGISGFGKLGAAYATSKNQVTASSSAILSANCSKCSDSKSNFNPYFGLGLEYDLTKTVALRLEYEDFGNFGNSFRGSPIDGGTGRSKASMWSLGASMAF